MRDDFTKLTIATIAKRAGFRCSNPGCGCSTVGPALGHEGIINVGIAAHITAASPGGPRFDPSLTPEQRRHESNGIWACQTDGKLIDSDSKHFTVEMLRKWKRSAEIQAFLALAAPHLTRDQRIARAGPDTVDRELELLGLTAQEYLESVTLPLIGAAQNDLAAFKHMPRWPRNAITLNLRITDGDHKQTFNASGLAAAVETFNEIVIIAPPGTGKTTTLLQLVEAILSQDNSVAVFIPLSEWSSQMDSFFQSIVRRRAFAGVQRSTWRCSHTTVGWFLFWTAGTNLTQHRESVLPAKLDYCSANLPTLASLSALGVKRWTCRFPGRWLRLTHFQKANSWRLRALCAVQKGRPFSITPGELPAFVIWWQSRYT